jgi:hypothetical protein
MRRFAYGFKRQQSDFAAVEYDDIFLEDSKQRPVLAELIRDGLRSGHGDLIIVLDEADIPIRGPMRDAIEAKGAAIEVAGLTEKKKGRPTVFNPTDEQMVRIKEIWNTPYFETYATKLISEILGREVSRYTLRRQLGKRDFAGKE